MFKLKGAVASKGAHSADESHENFSSSDEHGC